MKLIQTAILDVVLIEPNVYQDERGWFMESFNEQRFHAELRKLGLPIPPPFVQDNHSRSKKGVLRGLHYQREPHTQGKLVRVVSGAAFDVAVDIRSGSPTFGQWAGQILSADNKLIMWIPESFAHGFLALEEGTELLYKATSYYSKEHEASIRWNDSRINIKWPGVEGGVITSVKDEFADSFLALEDKKRPAAT